MLPVLLEISGLKVDLEDPSGSASVLRGVDLAVGEGERVALVGESGCGKSMTALSLLDLLPSPPMRRTAGRVVFAGEDISNAPPERWRELRGGRIGVIFQEPLTSLNPVFRAGDQVDEAVRAHQDVTPSQARERTLALFREAGLPDPERVASQYPHQLSGGMCQRVMVAMALACQPPLLVADEPTTALDVTVQAQILDLLNRLSRERKMSLLLITHDLSLVGNATDRTIILYAGLVMEEAPTRRLLARPRHPYTAGLLACQPALARRGEVMTTIPGTVPALRDEFPGCPFAPRCPRVQPKCTKALPGLKVNEEKEGVRCFFPL